MYRPGWDINSPFTDWSRHPKRWLDHLSREVDNQYTEYISEPYSLDSSDIINLASLTKDWDVEIAGKSDHNPGHTLKIILTRRKEKHAN